MSDSPTSDKIAPPRLGEPGVLQRWLGIVPALMCFFVLSWALPRGSSIAETFRQMQVDVPLPTILAIAICEHYRILFWIWLPFMFGVCWLYFAWASKRHDRLLWFSTFFTAFLLFAFFIFFGGFFLPLMKIQEALQKK